MKFFNIALLAIGIGFAGAAAAHSDEYLDTVKAPNGGQLRMAGNYHYELLIQPAAKGKPHEVLVFLTDHADQEIESKGATGTVTILSSTKAKVVLQPAGENLMKGSASFGINPNLKAVVSITLPGQQAEQARFTPLAAKHGDPGHKH